MGWSLSQWSALAEPEQIFWLALELRRQQELKRLLESQNRREYIDLGAYIHTLLEMI